MNRYDCYEMLRKMCSNEALEVVNNDKDQGTVYIKGTDGSKTRFIQIYFRPTKTSILVTEKAKNIIENRVTLSECTNMIGTRYNYERVQDGFITEICDAFINGFMK